MKQVCALVRRRVKWKNYYGKACTHGTSGFDPFITFFQWNNFAPDWGRGVRVGGAEHVYTGFLEGDLMR